MPADLNSVAEPNRTAKKTIEWQTTVKRWPNGRRSARRNWTNSLKHFEIEYDAINLTTLTALEAFFNSHQGEYATFTFTDNHTGITYTVAFDQPTFDREMVIANSRGVYKVKLKLVEDAPS
jgi:hypothetical protein